jgi:hypothetical protein
VSVTAIADWGPLVISTDVDDAVLNALRQWMPTYLAQIRKERNLTFTPALPRTYSNTFAEQEFLDHQLPAMIAVTAQATATVGGSNMAYDATWALELAAVVRGKRPPSTRYLASLYEGVARRVVLQKARGAPLNAVKWIGSRTRQVADATGQGRYIVAEVCLFQVFSDQVVQPYAGPDTPDAATYLDEATVTEVDIQVLGSQMPPITSGP